MIQRPRRSVTRFFIPLIDVLLLLFCIFLLMPIVNLDELESQKQTSGDLSETVDSLERELARRTQELNKYEELKADLNELERLKEEVERLRRNAKLGLQQKTAFHVIDLDADTGGISWYDPSRPGQPQVKLDDAKAVEALFERHRKEAGDRELYYFFLYPRRETGYPTQAQIARYRTWFAGVAHSLAEVKR